MGSARTTGAKDRIDVTIKDVSKAEEHHLALEVVKLKLSNSKTWSILGQISVTK